MAIPTERSKRKGRPVERPKSKDAARKAAQAWAQKIMNSPYRKSKPPKNKPPKNKKKGKG